MNYLEVTGFLLLSAPLIATFAVLCWILESIKLPLFIFAGIGILTAMVVVGAALINFGAVG